jgi:hypothetical protein
MLSPKKRRQDFRAAAKDPPIKRAAEGLEALAQPAGLRLLLRLHLRLHLRLLLVAVLALALALAPPLLSLQARHHVTHTRRRSG